jgi:hypothetical protein
MADQTGTDSVPARKRHPGGRPPWIPTPEQVKQVENLSADGLSFQEIADALEISYLTLIRKRRQFAQFCNAFRRGRAAAHAVAGNIIMKNMTQQACPKCGMTPDPDRQLESAKFFLSRRAGRLE